MEMWEWMGDRTSWRRIIVTGSIYVRNSDFDHIYIILFLCNLELTKKIMTWIFRIFLVTPWIFRKLPFRFKSSRMLLCRQPFQKSVPICQLVRRHMPWDVYLQPHCCKKLKSAKFPQRSWLLHRSCPNMSRSSDTRFFSAERQLLPLDNGGSHTRLKREFEQQLWKVLIEI